MKPDLKDVPPDEKSVMERSKKNRRKWKPKNSTKPGMNGRVEIRIHIEGEGEK